ncbi:hypothetical protein BDL97_18G072200 [Sphagnum fallax]|nr:hypothetical protein BDL97_18G072200 [Sphagnum fallax]
MAEDRTSAIVRQATRQDVPLILKLVRELADYEKLGATCVATEAGFENSLFKSLPFQGPTVFILETSPIVSSVSPQAFQPNTQQCSSFGAPEHYIKTQGLDVGDCVSQSRALSCISNVETQGHDGLHTNEGICALKLEREEEWIQEKDMLVLKLVKTSTKTHKAARSEEHVCEVTLRRTIVDTDAKVFMSPSHKDRTVIGFVLFFPNYSTLLAKPGCYVEDLYIREPYRGHGYGSFLLKTIAQQAVKHGAERVEWCVLDWNVNAINFYKRIGATVMPEWKLCCLAGHALHTCKPEESPIQEPEMLQNLESFHFET